MVLAGWLAVPVRGEALAGVVLVGGSGPSDRDNGTYFPPIREHLVDAGIAVLSYDKRGVGSSSGDWLDSTLDDLAADATAALGFLHAQPEVRAGPAGLLGHSEGGWVALRAAAGRDDVPWVITSGCPGMTPAAQERHSLACCAVLASMMPAACWPCSTGLLRQAAAMTTSPKRPGSSVPPVRRGHSLITGPTWTSGCGSSSSASRITIPSPTRCGCAARTWRSSAERTSLVSVAESTCRFSAAACHPGRPEQAALTIEVFPGASHRIQVGASAGLAPGYLGLLAQWIKAKAGISDD